MNVQTRTLLGSLTNNVRFAQVTCRPYTEHSFCLLPNAFKLNAYYSVRCPGIGKHESTRPMISRRSERIADFQREARIFTLKLEA